MVKIEKHVPLPTLREEYSHYPFDEMDVGDSFYVPDVGDGRSIHRLQTQVSYMNRHASKATGKFTTRRVDGGLRVWRFK